MCFLVCIYCPCYPGKNQLCIQYTCLIQLCITSTVYMYMQNVAVIWNFALILFLPCETRTSYLLFWVVSRSIHTINDKMINQLEPIFFCFPESGACLLCVWQCRRTLYFHWTAKRLVSGRCPNTRESGELGGGECWYTLRKGLLDRSTSLSGCDHWWYG